MPRAYRWAAIATSCVLVAGACAPVRAAANNDWVVVTNSNGVAGLDWGAGRTVFQTPYGVPTPDWSRLFVSHQSGEQAKLEALDGWTGDQQSSVDVPGGLFAAAASADGQRVALAPRPTSSEWPPAGRDTTRIVVADTSGAGEQRSFDLQGNYDADAFSTDNQTLFVLEYQPPQAPDRYSVRQLDLRSGTLSAIGSRFKVPVPEEDMRGTRHAHVLSPDRGTLYTLYTNQPDHLHSRDLAAGKTQSSGDVYAFVHVLSLSQGWAYCMDLPQPIGTGPTDAQALALSPDGRWLYVADQSSGTLAVADTNQLIVRATTAIGADSQATSASSAAVVGPDHSLYLSSAADILVLDSRTLAVQRHLALAGTPTGLGMSVDGQRLFVSTQDGVIALDPRSGSTLGEVHTPGTQRIEYVGQLANR